MKVAKKILLGILIAVAALVVAFLIYVIYVLIAYNRIDDYTPVETVHYGESQDYVKTGVEYSAVSYNVGFGAYVPSFSFFMDGGKQSWADSEESVVADINAIGDLLEDIDPDFLIIQEIDTNSTRTYHINQVDILMDKFANVDTSFALNFHSSFLMYPFLEPHGKVLSGLLTISKFDITDSMRRSFPISQSVTKLVDLDRCLNVSRIPVENGKELILVNMHMSAYGNSDAVRVGQKKLVAEILEEEYMKGNYVICGGDFNHDLKIKDPSQKGVASWAFPYDRSLLPEGFSFALDEKSDAELSAMVNTCRDAGVPYDPATTLTFTLDGFIISDNVSVTYYDTVDTDFAYSDHEPVSMKFILNP